MADKEPDELKRKGSDGLLDPVKKKPRDDTSPSQGSKPQNTQPDEQPSPIAKLQDILPDEYEEKICDVSSDEGANEVSMFLKGYYVYGGSRDRSLDQGGFNQYEYEYDYEYSKDYLRWLLCPPSFKKDWHISVEDKSKKQLVAFIAAVPKNMKATRKIDHVLMAEVKFLCVLPIPGYEKLEPLLLKEMARRVKLHGALSVIFASINHFTNNELMKSGQNWSRPLNIKKLFDLKFIKLAEGMTIETTERAHDSLLTSPPTQGLRKMEAKDVPAVTTLLRTYLDCFTYAPRFNEREVEHWFLPRADIVESYVVESENKDITHFISFSTLSFSISIVDVHDSTSAIKAARSLYNVSTEAQPHELLRNALALAKSNGSDFFEAVDIMDNKDQVLEGLMFRRSHPYSLARLSKEVEPSQFGLELF